MKSNIQQCIEGLRILAKYDSGNMRVEGFASAVRVSFPELTWPVLPDCVKLVELGWHGDNGRAWLFEG